MQQNGLSCVKHEALQFQIEHDYHEEGVGRQDMRLKDWRKAATRSETDTGDGTPGDERENLVSLNAATDFFHEMLRFRFKGEPRFWTAAKLFARHILAGLSPAENRLRLSGKTPLALFVLDRFFEKTQSSGNIDTPCFSGPNVKGLNNFIAVKWINSVVDFEVPDIHSKSIIKDIVDEIRNMIDAEGDTAFNIRGNFTNATLEKAHAALKLAKRVAPDPGTRAVRRKRPDLGNRPLWFTSREAFDLEVAALLDDSEGIVASAYGAGLRWHLGLYSAHDNVTDARIPTYGFRVCAIIEADFMDDALKHTAQPSILSKGDAQLFVSRKKRISGGSTGMDGKTVRLRDNKCSHDATCKCGRPGLPEAVVPESVFVEQALQLRSLALVSTHHLRRYTKPELNNIRRNNPYGS